MATQIIFDPSPFPEEKARILIAAEKAKLAMAIAEAHATFFPMPIVGPVLALAACAAIVKFAEQKMLYIAEHGELPPEGWKPSL